MHLACQVGPNYGCNPKFLGKKTKSEKNISFFCEGKEEQRGERKKIFGEGKYFLEEREKYFFSEEKEKNAFFWRRRKRNALFGEGTIIFSIPTLLNHETSAFV